MRDLDWFVLIYLGGCALVALGFAGWAGWLLWDLATK